MKPSEVRSDPAPLAGGVPISEACADQAAEWWTVLMSGEADGAELRRWSAWRAADPEHERAWLHMEAVADRFKGLHAGAAYRSLSALAAPRSAGRRKGIKTLLWLGATGVGAAGGAGLLAARAPALESALGYALADYRSAVGQRRELTLADGSRVTLNTDSAINVRFDAERRLLRLVAGEVMIATGHAGAAARPPFVVETAEGSVRALGTRFTVRQRAGRTEVAVLDSAVAIAPSRYAGAELVLPAGQRLAFTRTEAEAPVPVQQHAAAWVRGLFIADDVRLDEFLADIGRYRRGWLRCDPALAHLRISGVFPLADTDRILAMLADTLPLRVRSRSPYWVTLEAAR